MLGPKGLGTFAAVVGLLGLSIGVDALASRSWIAGSAVLAISAAMMWEWKVSRKQAPEVCERMLLISLAWMALYAFVPPH